MASAQDLLTATENAYLAACAAQDYSTGGRRVLRALLKDLLDARSKLKDEINSAGPMFELGQQDRPSLIGN